MKEEDIMVSGWTGFDLNKAYEDMMAKPKEEPKLEIKCPLCKSDNIWDSSTYDNNGIMGPGYSSWKTTNNRCCNDCGIMFIPVIGNGLKEEK